MRALLYVLIPLLLAGCGSFHKQSIIQGRDKHYLTANSAPKLRIPPGLASYGVKNEYPIPTRNYPEKDKSVSILPLGIKAT